MAVFLLFGLQMMQAQHLNSYQYVVIPAEFDFQKGTNQYQLNELLKFLFEKEGFEAFLDNEPLPSELSANACKGLRARVRNESGMFRTKLFIELRDCNNVEVFISREGVSREKEYEKAYQEALRAAFQSISDLNYSIVEEENLVEVTAVPEIPEENVVEVTAVLPAVQDEKEVAGEIEQKLPAEDKDTEEVDEGLIRKGDNDRIFLQKDGSEFFLEKTPSGFNLYQNGMAEPFASLIKSSAGESYLYSSVTAKGMANFGKEGNLIVEVLDPATNNLRTSVYQKRD
ncbi:MAG TPA: hypothetical protein VK941_07765 [Gillisia sp.]|nr:hypothetical protein [Gillisia sp.]